MPDLCFRLLLLYATERGPSVSLNFLVWQMGKKMDCVVPPAETGVG